MEGPRETDSFVSDAVSDAEAHLAAQFRDRVEAIKQVTSTSVRQEGRSSPVPPPIACKSLKYLLELLATSP